MQFRVLGALEVWHDGDRVRIEGAKPAKALAVLLLEANRTLPVHRLIDALWDDEPPATAKRQVQNYLAAVRRELAANGDDPIERIGDGYRLATDDLDWLHFQRDVARARSGMDAGRTSEARDLLTRALGRWRGPALAGLESRLIASAAERLNAAHLSATEHLIGVELDLGEYGSAIARARTLLDADPYRQKTIGRLMLALHRDGRSAEALGVYADIRSTMADRLGLDPDDALQRLHCQILRNEASVPFSPHPRTPVPAQLPAEVPGFVGRDGELAELDATLQRDPAMLTTLTGTGGSGKTALAVHWGHRRRKRFPDGQLYVDLRGYDTAEPIDPRTALRSMLRGLGLAGASVPADVDEAAALYRSLVADRAMLIVLDNARTMAQIRPLLPGGEHTATVVTSRDRLRGLTAVHGARSITLGPMRHCDAVDLLASMVGPDRLVGSPEAAHRIAELCAYQPLAVRVAGANLAGRERESVAAFAAELAEDTDRLALLTVDGDPEVSVAAAFDRSFVALAPQARHLLCLLGALPAVDFAAELIEAVASGSGRESKRALAQLTSAHVLERYRPGRYRFPDLMRLYAERLAATLLTDEQRDEAVDRCNEWLHASRRPEDSDSLVDPRDRWIDHPEPWRRAPALRPDRNDATRLPFLYQMDSPEFRK